MVFLKALSVFLGTVIGVGIFGLPFVAFKAGFFVIILFFLLMILVAVSIHFLYAEIVLGTKKIHRLPGYVEEYLGEKWKKITFLVVALGLMGALLAYLIVGGEFLNFLFAPYFGGSPFLYTLLFFALGSYLVFRGMKSISGVELSLLIVILIILVVFFIKALPSINIAHFKTLDFKFLTLPYGVVLFSLWGSALVPEIKEMFAASGANPHTKRGQGAKGAKNNEVSPRYGVRAKEIRTNLRKVILWGIIFAAVIYLFFIFIVLGASGPATSKEAISGLGGVLGNNVIKLGFIFGIIACFTSFIALALTLKKVFWYDFGLPKNLAWFLTCFLPLALFLFGVREFIGVIGFTGAIALGIEGIIIIFLYREFLKKKSPTFQRRRGMNPAFYLLVGIFILGIIFELAYFSGLL